MDFYTNATLHKGKVYLRGYKNQQRASEIYTHKPFVFVKARGESNWHAVDGTPVARLDFPDIGEMYDYMRQYKDVANYEIYGFTGYLSLYSHLNEKFPGAIEYDYNLLRIVNIDIEVASDEGMPRPEDPVHPVTAITISFRGKFYAFATVNYVPAEGIYYTKCADETEVLRKFIDKWREIDPDIVTNWNGSAFDMPYIHARVTQLCGKDFADKLSPYGIVLPRTFVKFNSEQHQIEIVGVAQLDYLELYRKFTQSVQESYKLDYISHVELKTRKIDYSQYGDLLTLYMENPQLFMEYNVRDVQLVDRLDAKLGMISLIVQIAYDTKINYVDAYTSVKMWDITIHNYLWEQNLVVPNRQVTTKIRQNAGGFVMDPEPGLYNLVTNLDFSGLYPSNMITFNISPDTFVGQIGELQQLADGDPLSGIPPNPTAVVDRMLAGYITPERQKKAVDNNLVITGSGALFRKDKQGFIPALLERIASQRDNARKMMNIKKKEKELIRQELERRGVTVADDD